MRTDFPSLGELENTRLALLAETEMQFGTWEDEREIFRDKYTLSKQTLQS